MEDNGSYLAEVLRYDGAADSWFPAGTLTEARRSFAVALLKIGNWMKVFSHDVTGGLFEVVICLIDSFT